MPQISNFRLPRVHRFFTKNGSYDYGAELRWGPPTVHLGANGVPFGKKRWVKTVKNYHAPKFEFSTTPRSLIFRKKWGPIGSKKWVKAIKKIPCPKLRIFDYPAVIHFHKKWKLRLWRQITVGTPQGPSCGQWGPIGSKKWVKAIKNYDAPNFEFSTTPRSSIFHKKWKIRLWRQITVGTPEGPSWGQWGPIGSKKWVKTVRNNHAPKVEFSTTPRSAITPKKWKLRLWRQITVQTP